MPAPTFEEFCGDFRQFRAMVGNVLQKASDGPMKQQLSDAVKALDEQFREVLTVYPQARAELQARQEAVVQKLRQQQARINAMKEEAAQVAAAPPIPKVPAPPKPVSIDPKLGSRLREELLARFGRPKKETVTPAIREVWEDWDWDHWEKEKKPDKDQGKGKNE